MKKIRSNPFIEKSIFDFTVQELLDIPLDAIKHHSTEEGKEFCVELFFNYYRDKGFPYYNLSPSELEREYKKFKKYEVSRILLNDELELQQVMLGLNVVNSFHPQMWSVKCREKLSPMDVFSDDKLFKRALMKRINMSDSKMATFNVRKSLKIFSGSQSVSNFRPTISKFLYERFCDETFVVLDPCMGYGGRLLGASTSVGKYVGVDPSTEAIAGNNNLANFIQSVEKKTAEFELINAPFEDVEFEGETFDFIFTSPPYFNVEKYSYEETQSHMRYQKYDIWVEGFLKPFIYNSFRFLKTGRYFALNVHGEDLIKDSLRIALECGFTLVETHQMRLSKICGRGQNKTIEKYKHEPIFIFKK